MRLRGHQLRGPDVSELYRRAGDRVGEAHHLNNLAVDLYFEGDWVRAAALYREAAELCVITGNVVYEATALNNIAEILSDQGRYADAEVMFRHAGRTWRSVGFATGIALIEANLGRLAMRTGGFDSAGELLVSSLTRFERLGADAFVQEVHLRIIENALRAGEPIADDELARHARVASCADWDANLVAYAERLIATVERLAGRYDEAAAAIERSLAAARVGGIQFDLALALAERGDIAEANEIFRGLGVDLDAAAHVAPIAPSTSHVC
jgi:tetratricopeptide (TPR) repeat protein